MSLTATEPCASSFSPTMIAWCALIEAAYLKFLEMLRPMRSTSVTLPLWRNFAVILNASSVVGLYGNFGQTNYAATKAGVIGMTKVWAREFGRKGITANAVAPGFIRTEMVDVLPENVVQAMQEKAPAGRLGTVDEVAAVYAFLASEEAGFINGATISVDGGLTL